MSSDEDCAYDVEDTGGPGNDGAVHDGWFAILR